MNRTPDPNLRKSPYHTSRTSLPDDSAKRRRLAKITTVVILIIAVGVLLTSARGDHNDTSHPLNAALLEASLRGDAREVDRLLQAGAHLDQVHIWTPEIDMAAHPCI